MTADLPLAEQDLSVLVDEWLEWSDVAAALGVTVAKVRTLVREHQLAHAVPETGGKRSGLRIPALFIDGNEIVKGLPGLLTVLHDGGYDDREAIAWLYLDANLPGRPIDALCENRGAEAKRRAQSMAF